jgi:hypothetical protein
MEADTMAQQDRGASEKHKKDQGAPAEQQRAEDQRSDHHAAVPERMNGIPSHGSDDWIATWRFDKGVDAIAIVDGHRQSPRYLIYCLINFTPLSSD